MALVLVVGCVLFFFCVLNIYFVYPFPYQTLSGVFATNSGIAPHAALPHPLPPPKHVHRVWVWNGLWDQRTTLFARFGPITLRPKPPKIEFWPTLSPYAT